MSLNFIVHDVRDYIIDHMMMFPYTTPSKYKSHDQTHFTRRGDMKDWAYPFPSCSGLVFLVMKVQNEVCLTFFCV